MGSIQSALGDLAADGVLVSLTVFLAIVAIFAIKHLMRALVGSSMRQGGDAVMDFVINTSPHAAFNDNYRDWRGE